MANLHVRSMTTNPSNDIARKGVENLLPSDVFTDDVYDTSTKKKDYGDSVTNTALNKARLCKKICEKKDARHFQEFKTTLDALVAIILQPTITESK